ncbi:MAG: hypothetical protein SGCHY_004983 [Lobulomycetales sp.]
MADQDAASPYDLFWGTLYPNLLDADGASKQALQSAHMLMPETPLQALTPPISPPVVLAEVPDHPINYGATSDHPINYGATSAFMSFTGHPPPPGMGLAAGSPVVGQVMPQPYLHSSAVFAPFAHTAQPNFDPNLHHHHHGRQVYLNPPAPNHAHQTALRQPDAGPGGKTFTCPHYPSCKKVFSNPYALRSHMNCHTTERKHVCYCGTAFTRKHDLTRHRKISLQKGRTKCQDPYEYQPSAQPAVAPAPPPAVGNAPQIAPFPDTVPFNPLVNSNVFSPVTTADHSPALPAQHLPFDRIDDRL